MKTRANQMTTGLVLRLKENSASIDSSTLWGAATLDDFFVFVSTGVGSFVLDLGVWILLDGFLSISAKYKLKI